MSDIIQLLPDKVANQIAAGEVVQRPASVVKELLENAIDAKATSIQLIIKDAGRTLIQVVDNGLGMSITDARMAFERHATSKIRTTQDIFTISSKGFRGEALASIAAIAQVEMKTQQENQEIGTQIIIEGGEFITQNAISAQKGTSFYVKNLFFNVPARRKFLKTNNVEYKHILDEFIRVTLAHPDLVFHLFNNEEIIYRLKSGNLITRIIDIFGKKIQNFLVPIQEETDWIKISGFIGKPDCAKKNRNEQYFFANNRFFRSNYFNKAVNDAFEGLIQNGYFPSFFIFFEINPEMIDVNIHPTKTEIKFEDESSIYGLLRSVVKRSIGVYNLSESLDFKQDKEISFFTPKNNSIPDLSIKVNPDFNPFKEEKVLQSKINTSYSVPYNNYKPENKNNNSTIIYEFESKVNNQNELFEPNDSYKVFRLNNGFWIWESNKTYLIDVYRVSQTIFFNRNKNNKQVYSQKLLFPIEYPIQLNEKNKIESILNHLEKKGFQLRIIPDMIYFDALPFDFLQDKIFDFMDELLNNLDFHSEDDFELFFNKTISKIYAKNKNEVINPDDFISILKEFIKLNLPLYNPFSKKNYEIIDLFIN